ncbi:MAG: phosphopentomutase [Proteobacteria bacterium]|nr:phosphopentomutase [Pseudomonadota bacterium]
MATSPAKLAPPASRQASRVVLLVLDSCGCGAAADAAAYGDAGADTLGHTAAAVGGLALPALEALGLGRAAALQGVAAREHVRAAFGRLQPRAAGKDTTTGHWELAGLVLDQPFRTFPAGFPTALIDAFIAATGRPVLGNRPASGTEIIEELGPTQLATGAWIVYTSADSVFQIAAHEQRIPLAELYAACERARRLCDPLQVGRVIARPYVGEPGSFARTYNRHDYGMPPPSPTLLDALSAAGVPVVGVGKIGDIFSGRGLSRSVRTAGNRDGMQQTTRELAALTHGLIFVNLIDFDALYGHRRDAAGFALALREFDAALPALLAQVGPEDLLLITADHGNDPTFHGSDHTREQVPVLAYGPARAAGRDLGLRGSFADVAATIAEALGVAPPPTGSSFWSALC